MHLSHSIALVAKCLANPRAEYILAAPRQYNFPQNICIQKSRFVTTWRLPIAGHVFQGRRQGRAHEPTRELRPAETQSLSLLVPTDPGRVQGCWCPSWTTRTDLPIETIRTFQSRHLVTTSLAFADRQRDGRCVQTSDLHSLRSYPRHYYRFHVYGAEFQVPSPTRQQLRHCDT